MSYQRSRIGIPAVLAITVSSLLSAMTLANDAIAPVANRQGQETGRSAFTVEGTDGANATGELTQLTPPATPSLELLVREILIEAVEESYIDEKRWNRSVKRFDGLKFDGLKVSKREKRVNHGFWQRYEAWLLRPEETLNVEIQQLEQPAGEMGVWFSVLLTVRARCEAKFAHWIYGVKGMNGVSSADASVRLRLIMVAQPEVEFSFQSPIPEISLRPRVADIDIWLDDLDVRRIGVLKGDLANELGDGMRASVEELLQDQEKKFRHKLQKKLDK